VSARIRSNSLQLTVSDGIFDGIETDEKVASCLPIWPSERQLHARSPTSFPMGAGYIPIMQGSAARRWMSGYLSPMDFEKKTGVRIFSAVWPLELNEQYL
jgi:hypothetical protein